MNEVPIVQARANVMYYDDGQKKWIPMGMSKVQIYQHTVNNTFRVVGRKLQDHEVVINSAILKNLKYNQARPSFHQWRDLKQVYGLNFANADEADSFATAMLTALDTLNNQAYHRQSNPPEPPTSNPPSGPTQGYQAHPAPQHVQPQHPQPQYPGMHTAHQTQQQPQQNGQVPEPAELRLSQQTHRRVPSGSGPSVPVAPVAPPAPAAPAAPPAPAVPAAPPAPPVPAAPPAPAAPPVPAAPPPPIGAPAAPPAPPVPSGVGPPAPPVPGGGGPPAAPPPPPTGGSVGGGKAPLSFTEQLQAAKLKKRAEPEPGPEPVSNKPPIGGGGGGSHIDELQKLLARRKGKEEKESSETARTESPSPANQPPVSVSNTPPRSWEKPQTNGNRISNGQESPRPPRKRMPSLTGQENFHSTASGGASSSDLENLKQEILTEMRKEMNAMKLEILAAIRDSAR